MGRFKALTGQTADKLADQLNNEAKDQTQLLVHSVVFDDKTRRWLAIVEIQNWLAEDEN